MSYRVLEDQEELSRAAARALVETAGRAATERRKLTLALAGGSTPRRLYELLASEMRSEIPWRDVHIFWSDERYVPLDDRDSNYRMAREALLDAVPLPSENVHPPETDLADPDAAAERYEEAIRRHFLPDEPRFDGVLLGLGEDGHVASLFPGSPSLEEDRRLVLAVTDSPKPPPVRLTMTLPLINLAREVHFLVSGGGKREALAASRRTGKALPAQRVRRERTFWWVDREAAGNG